MQVQVNHNRFNLEKTYKLETHWWSHAVIRIGRSCEILLAHFRKSKIQNGSKFFFKMPVIITIKSWPGILNLAYYYRIYLSKPFSLCI